MWFLLRKELDNHLIYWLVCFSSISHLILFGLLFLSERHWFVQSLSINRHFAGAKVSILGRGGPQGNSSSAGHAPVRQSEAIAGKFTPVEQAQQAKSLVKQVNPEQSQMKPIDGDKKKQGPKKNEPARESLLKAVLKGLGSKPKKGLEDKQSKKKAAPLEFFGPEEKIYKLKKREKRRKNSEKRDSGQKRAEQ